MKGIVDGKGMCEEFSNGYYGVCAIGGMLSAGTTHLAITPLDVLKVNMQVHPIKYRSISTSFTTLLREQGPSAFWRGWAGKFFGYGMQSTSAEVIANVALCPFEVIKVRVQAQPHYAKGLADGFPKLYMSEGLHGLYRGIIPVWGHISTINANEKAQQLGVTCLAGYAAGSVGSIIFNPADNIVATLNNKKANNLKQIFSILVFYDTIKVLNGLPTSGHVRTEIRNTAKTHMHAPVK